MKRKGDMCVTHKVLSLGMWLKLDTGILLMLLLFSVLQNINEPIKSL